MDHQRATELGAVEKFLLDELPPAQRDEFEEHFFGCQDCATDLRMTAEFLDLARKELGRGTIERTATKPQKRSWFDVFARPAVLTPAFGLLLGIIVYQNSVVLPRFSGQIADLRQPQVVTSVSLIGGNSRGGTLPQVSGPAGQPVLLSFDIPAAQPYPAYTCVLIDASGAVIWRIPVSASLAQDTVSISVPAGALHSGDYTLVVQGVGPKTTDLARYRFQFSPRQ
jgi:Putative zinc-finger